MLHSRFHFASCLNVFFQIPAVRQVNVFHHDRDAIANHALWVIVAGVHSIGLVDNFHVLADANVLVDDCSLDYRPRSKCQRDIKVALVLTIVFAVVLVAEFWMGIAVTGFDGEQPFIERQMHPGQYWLVMALHSVITAGLPLLEFLSR